METIELAHAIIDALEDKKGENIVLMDIRELADFAEYFVICSGTSDRMLQALADAIMEKIKEKFGQRSRLEGLPQDGWMLVDFGDIVVHLFSPDRRSYYRLEDLWGRGKVILRLQ